MNRVIQSDLLKIAGYGRKKPLHVKTGLVSPPFNPVKEGFRSHEVKTILFKDGDVNVLNEFIKQVLEH